MRHVTDDERRARLAVRHALTPGSRLVTPEEATRAVTVLHATDPATVYLSCWARCSSLEVADVDRALYEDRTLVKQLAMRRTVFVLPADLVAPTWGSASARVAAAAGGRLARDAVTAGGEAWLEQARRQVLAALEPHPEGLPAAAIRERVPMLGGEGSRVLVYLGARADVVRAANTGHWRTARPRWTLARHWLDDVPEPWTAADGYCELVRRWLRSFGPGTEADLVWWLGATKAAVRTALAELGAVEVSLDRGATGWLLPDDLDEAPDPGHWVALLPVLDPTTMAGPSGAST